MTDITIGAGLIAKMDQDFKTTGKWVIVGDLVIQLIFSSLCILVSSKFHSNIHKSPTELSKSRSIPWRRPLYLLYGASIFVMVRSVFQVVEYVQGDHGCLLRREPWLYIFDAALMAAVMLLFNIVHPSKVGASSTVQRRTDTVATDLGEVGSYHGLLYPTQEIVGGPNAG